MFERYTEKARRAIFFARYEASQFGSPYIEAEYLLMGLLRADHEVFHALGANVAKLRKAVERESKNWHRSDEKLSTSVDLPLADECKRALAFAAEEAERLAHRHIGTEHLVLGLLREEKTAAARILHQQGLKLSAARGKLSELPPGGSVGYEGGIGGGGDATVRSAARTPPPAACMEFVDSETGQRLGIVGMDAVPFVPRTGETVVLPVNGVAEEFRVVEVSCDFRPFMPGSQYRVDECAGVRLRVTRRRSGAAWTTPLEST